jgi:hypothetical protein
MWVEVVFYISRGRKNINRTSFLLLLTVQDVPKLCGNVAPTGKKILSVHVMTAMLQLAQRDSVAALTTSFL